MVNEKRCQIKAMSIKYIGHILKEEDLRILGVKDVVSIPLSIDVSKMFCFLGLAQLCAKFVPHFSTLTARIWDFMRLDTE